MTIKVGINGFGRIGRLSFRAIAREFPDIEVVAVNDLLDPDYLAYMLKYDSVHGRFNGDVTVDGNNMTVDGKKIRLTAETDPANLKWGEAGADLVIDCTGMFLTEESCRKHIQAGARKVLQSAPSKDATPMFVYGVNHKEYAGQEIVSAASCTTNCLAPVCKVLNDNFGISHGYATTIHSYTMTQRILDGSHKDLRRARAAAMSQIPTTTGATKAVGEILPELDGKLDGMAVRVPTPSGSLIDLVCELEKTVTPEKVNQIFKENAQETLGYTEEPLVSVDFLGDSHGAVVDAMSTRVMNGTMVKVLAWYDNEAGFTHQLLRLLRRVARDL